MRFAHMADIHLDSPFRVLALKDDLADKRRLEQREAFRKGIEYVKKENIPFLFISGDLYEQEYIRESTIEFINNLFKTIPNTKIFISPGNHDPFLNNSFYNTFNWSENVTIFDGQIKRIEFPEVDIYGYGFSDFYCINSGIEEIEIKNKEKINILIIHGALDASKSLDMQYNPINSAKLKKIGFDYVALGHIHKTNYNNNENNFIYPGSLISFGFDEIGRHGFLDIKINKNNIENKFNNLEIKNNYLENNLNNSEIKNNYLENNLNNSEIKNNYLKNNLNNSEIKNNYSENNLNNSEIKNNYSENKLNNLEIKNNYLKNNLNNEKNIEINFIKIEDEVYLEKNIDISDIDSEEDVIEKINNDDYENDKFYKIILTGRKNLEINKKRICKLAKQKNILKVKDETEIEYEINKLIEQRNLKGMFVKNLLNEMKKNPENKNKIEEALKIGLKMFD